MKGDGTISVSAGGTGSIATARNWLRALRIKHWIKNFFVLAPFLVGPRFGYNGYLIMALAGTAVFCLMSSSIYLLNDVADMELDRLHPQKSGRPIAAGLISPAAALTVSLLLGAFSITAAYTLNRMFFLTVVAYLANNLLYSFYLKKKTVLDIISISVGFVLRVFAGGYIIDITITKWFVTCVFSLALVFGFGKRRAEYEDLQEKAGMARDVQSSYSVQKLNLLLAISASITIVTYMLYTMAPETRAIHGTDNLLYTTPLVVYAIYRYMLKVQEKNTGGPVELILKDRGFLVAGILWLAVFMYIIRFS